jgi:hypothetical protein
VSNLSAEDLLDWGLYQVAKYDIESMFPVFTLALDSDSKQTQALVKDRLIKLGRLRDKY